VWDSFFMRHDFWRCKRKKVVLEECIDERQDFLATLAALWHTACHHIRMDTLRRVADRRLLGDLASTSACLECCYRLSKGGAKA